MDEKMMKQQPWKKKNKQEVPPYTENKDDGKYKGGENCSQNL